MILTGRRFPKESITLDRFYKTFGNGWIGDKTIDNKNTYYNIYSKGGPVRSFNLNDFIPMQNINLDNVEFTIEKEEYTQQYSMVLVARTVENDIDQGIYTYDSIIEVIEALYNWRGVV